MPDRVPPGQILTTKWPVLREERYGGRGLTQHEINRFRNQSKKGL